VLFKRFYDAKVGNETADSLFVTVNAVYKLQCFTDIKMYNLVIF